jgi:hypothetical protein
MMATFDTIERNRLEPVAIEIARLFNMSRPALGGVSNFNVDANVAIWLLDTKLLMKGVSRIRQLATQTPRWWHILSKDDTVLGDAVTEEDPDTSQLKVKSVHNTKEVAHAFLDAINWIGQALPPHPDFNAHYLVSPALYLRAIWLDPVSSDPLQASEGLVVVCDPAPGASGLQTKTFYREGDFLRALSTMAARRPEGF